MPYFDTVQKLCQTLFSERYAKDNCHISPFCGVSPRVDSDGFLPPDKGVSGVSIHREQKNQKENKVMKRKHNVLV